MKVVANSSNCSYKEERNKEWYMYIVHRLLVHLWVVCQTPRFPALQCKVITEKLGGTLDKVLMRLPLLTG